MEELEVEPRPFHGDLGYLAEVRGLTETGAPALVESDGRFALTEFGRNLLCGNADWVEANGIDRWLGGVRLSGHATRWRYDQRLETLVTT